MGNTNESAKPNHPSSAHKQHWWAGIVAYVKRKSRERRAKKEKEKPEHRALRLTMCATVAIAIFTLVLVVVGWLQYREIRDSGAESSEQMNQMLREYRSQVAQLKKQAGDTHALAETAGKQADSSKKIAQNAAIQSKATRDLAAHAAGQLNTMQSQLELSQRPWLYTTATAVSPLTFTDGQASVTVRFTIHNSGNGPAINVSFIPIIRVSGVEQPDWTIAGAEQTCRFYQLLNSKGDMSTTGTIFPTTVRNEDFTLQVGKAEFTTGGKTFPFEVFRIRVIACLDYQPSFYREQPYSTVVIYSVFRRVSDAPVANLFRINDDVEEKELFMTSDTFPQFTQ